MAAANERRLLHQDIANQQRDTMQNAAKVLDLHKKLRKDRPTMDIYMQQPIRSHRFPPIVCYDQTRYAYAADENKFFHANWVDGYAIQKQYLLATAPHTKTKTEDFWAMAVAEMPLAIVVMNDGPEQATRIETQFWPQPNKEYKYSRGEVRSLAVLNNELLTTAPDGSFQKFRMTLVKYRADETTRTEAVLFVMKNDASAVPGYFPQLRGELSRLRKEVNKAKPKKHHSKARDNILLVCGDGVTKNGNFCVFDIVMDRAVDKDLVGLKETVKIVKNQRYGTVDTLDQYRQLNGLLLAHLHDFHNVDGSGDRASQHSQTSKRHKPNSLHDG